MEEIKKYVITLLLLGFVAASIYAGLLAYGQLGRPFFGFLTYQNLVVGPIDHLAWEGHRAGVLFHDHLQTVAGQPVSDIPSIYKEAATKGGEKATAFGFARGSGQYTVKLGKSRLQIKDLLFTFGFLLLTGISFFVIGSIVAVKRAKHPAAFVFFINCLLIAFYFILGFDFITTCKLNYLLLICFCFIPPTILHLALIFPARSPLLEKHSVILVFPYIISALLAIPYLAWFSSQPQRWVAVELFVIGYLALAYLAWLILNAKRLRRETDQMLRTQRRIILLSLSLAYGLVLLVGLLVIVNGTAIPLNYVAPVCIFFPLAIAYSISRHKLFAVEKAVRVGLVYTVFTSIIALLYATLLFTLRGLFEAFSGTFFQIAFLVIAVLLLEPLKKIVQRTIDRIFYKTPLDYSKALEKLSGEMVTILNTKSLVQRTLDALTDLVGLERAALYLANNGNGYRRFLPSVKQTNSSLPAEVGDGDDIIVANRKAHQRGRGCLEVRAKGSAPFLNQHQLELSLPIADKEKFRGAMLLGEKLSGDEFSRSDKALFRTLANQLAIALSNAELYENLEGQVEKRTRELNNALEGLKAAQAKLVQSSKMASLGVLVAGIAHEMKNSINVISSNIGPMEKYFDTLKGIIDKSASEGKAIEQKELEREHDYNFVRNDIEELIANFKRGSQRTLKIIDDLRLFSRTQQAEVKEVSLRDNLETTLSLLSKSIGNEITIHRDYTDVAPILCNPGQINQVFMNLLVNASQAIEGKGDIWIRLFLQAEDAVVEVRDNGKGIAENDLARIFDPFFSTKEEGQGVGLGLSISYSVVQDHGGKLEVKSSPGKGSTFTVKLPIKREATEE